MNTKILAAVAGIVILLGAAGFMVMNQNKTSTNTQIANEKESTGNTNASILDLINMGKDYRCTFDYDDGKFQTKGTVYIAKGQIRNDFTTTQNGKTQEMHLIRNGNDNYVWGGDMQGGIKLTMDIKDVADNTQANQYVDLNAKNDYNCVNWTVDQSLFTPPSDVKFTDLTSMMPKSKAPSTGNSPCDKLTDTAARAACDKAFSSQ